MTARELDGQEREQAPGLADELLPDLILLGVSLAVQVGALVLLSKRDVLARAWVRLQARASATAERDRHDVTVAQFRRELAAWEHEQAGR